MPPKPIPFVIALPGLDLANIFAAAASLILSILAIGLSIVFYRMSVGESAKTMEAAARIEAGVARLEALFDRMYTDTFSIMKETVGDMRAHAWSGPTTLDSQATNDIRVKFDKEIDDIRNQTRTEIDELITAQGELGEQLGALTEKIENVVDQAIAQTLNATQTVHARPLAKEIARWMNSIGMSQARTYDIAKAVGATSTDAIEALKILRELGWVTWDSQAGPTPSTMIRRSPG